MKIIWSHRDKELFFSVQFAEVSSSCHEILPGPWLPLLQLMTLQPVWRWRTVSERFSAMLRRSAPHFISNTRYDVSWLEWYLHHKFTFVSQQKVFLYIKISSVLYNNTEQKITTLHYKYHKINNLCIFRNRKMRKDVIIIQKVIIEYIFRWNKIYSSKIL